MISFAEAVNNLHAFSTVLSPNELRDCFDKLPVVERNSSVEPLSPLICERCGGTIDRESMICPYCDTAYKQKRAQLERHYIM